MLKRSLRIKVMVTILSAAFFVCENSIVDAYTYSGITSTIDAPIYDSSDLIITDGSAITSKNDIYPYGIAQGNVIKENIISGSTIWNRCIAAVQLYNDDDGSYYSDYNDSKDKYTIRNDYMLEHIISKYAKEEDNALQQVVNGKTTAGDSKVLAITKDFNSPLEALQSIQSHYFTKIAYSSNPGSTIYTISGLFVISSDFDSNKSFDENWNILEKQFPNLAKAVKIFNLTKDDTYESAIKDAQAQTKNITTYSADGMLDGDELNIYLYDKPLYEETVIDSSIIVSSKSTLLGQKNIRTSKSINVTGTSKLTTATGTITGGTITSDGDIVAQANYSAPSGKSTIAGASITSTGALTASKDIKAMTGAISGTVINATGGNVVASNTIKSTGKVKGNAFNVGVINASSASITGNQAINGIFTTTGQAKLNGGATLGGKKITGLNIGTLSTTSTDAVNGKQLYTAMQSSGKTYTAGSDISISSANAISVAKAGKVASGNTGIMIGDAVYQATSKIDSIFKANNTSITSNNSKLDNLTTSIESLRKSLGTINSSVSDAISSLPGSLTNFANKDLTDLSDTGINTLKSYIKSEIKKQIPSNSKTASYAMEASDFKDTSAIDNVIASKANTSDLTALGSKVESKADKSDVSLLEDKVNAKADLSYVNDGLTKKADQSVVEAIGRDVDRNTSVIAKNTELIQSNTEAISELNDSKADVSSSNIDSSSWSEKLGTGTVTKDDTGLVTGSSAASALDQKADIGYVAIGLGTMESGLDQMSQEVTKDVSRVGAGASALMGLHPTGDKFEFATAYGHYKNSNNTALGVFYKPTANSTVSVAGTIGDGDAMLSAGVSIKLGLNKEVKKVITPEEFGTMKTTVDSQDEKLDQMEKTLQQLMAR